MREIGELVACLRREIGLSVLIAEQNLALAFAVADRVYVMERGSMVNESSAVAFHADAALQKKYLGV